MMHRPARIGIVVVSDRASRGAYTDEGGPAIRAYLAEVLASQVSLQYVPTAILSRQTAGVCGTALVVNLPGRPKSIRECLDAVFPAIPYCVDLIHTGVSDAPRLDTRPERLVAFRPGA